MITQTIRGTWSVHDSEERPVDGVAVHYFPASHQWRCENHGQRCEHVRAVLEYLALRGLLLVRRDLS